MDKAVAGTTPFTADFQDFITRTAWGDLWQRPGLSRRDRSLMTLSITIALRHWDEFALHVRAARNNGLSDEEIAEVVQHAAVYAGVPAANHAFKVAAPILEELRGEEQRADRRGGRRGHPARRDLRRRPGRQPRLQGGRPDPRGTPRLVGLSRPTREPARVPRRPRSPSASRVICRMSVAGRAG